MSVPFDERPTCSIEEACDATGLGRSMLYEMMADGRLAYTKLGNRRLVRVDSLLRLVAPKEERV
jgi:excisionase family DNA binding protein